MIGEEDEGIRNVLYAVTQRPRLRQALLSSLGSEISVKKRHESPAGSTMASLRVAFCNSVPTPLPRTQSQGQS